MDHYEQRTALRDHVTTVQGGQNEAPSNKKEILEINNTGDNERKWGQMRAHKPVYKAEKAERSDLEHLASSVRPRAGGFERGGFEARRLRDARQLRDAAPRRDAATSRRAPLRDACYFEMHTKSGMRA
ncbi:hypothetical protein C8R45DRAFT_934369 [Mycena sanguinolenta]|nr:hypothetical protein C8R45DRAFT_934369 [Mycena sanguinolenta]